ncbi:MAG TPA: formate dehydrogenase subunit gamma [Nitrospirae bacterium]|nr:formate dehydrogenase subunit gamma [Nitrospirota bacterium]
MSEMVRKASIFEIFNHWVLAISCILLALSGYGFLFKIELIINLFGGANMMKEIHNYIGIVFAISLFLSIFNWLKDALSFDKDDINWIACAGGYLSKNPKVPPMGKLNTGQKFFYIAILVFGTAITVTGFILWLFPENKTYILWSHLIHNISFVVIMIAVPVHIYLATVANPGTFRIMVYGTVPYKWAEKRHSKWIREVQP